MTQLELFQALPQRADLVMSYYGSKYRLARKYPAPLHRTIIEPFAGGASYSLHYPDHQVKLYDLNEKLCAVWDYVIRAHPNEIRALPILGLHDSVDDFPLISEAKWLIGWWINVCATTPTKRRTPHSKSNFLIGNSCTWGEKRREKIALTSERIKHWTITRASYETIPDEPATWFVDPPYQCRAGRHYRHNAIDFSRLAGWCQNRSGQIMVCENSDSPPWLPFTPFLETVGATIVDGTRKRTNEVIWYRERAPSAP